jgi:hypothetical protein
MIDLSIHLVKPVGTFIQLNSEFSEHPGRITLEQTGVIHQAGNPHAQAGPV